MKRILFVFSMVLSASVAFAVDNKENLENETGLQGLVQGALWLMGAFFLKVLLKGNL